MLKMRLFLCCALALLLAPTACGRIGRSGSTPTAQLSERPVQVPSSTVSSPPTEAQQHVGGADSPDAAVIAALKAIENNDANAYLDVVDPQFRSNIGNYFFFSQVMGALTQTMGLGNELGKSASQIAFRDLTTSITEVSGEVAQVRVSGYIRSPAFATENAFEDVVTARQVDDRWYISQVTSTETASATRAAEARLTDSLPNLIVQKGELVLLQTGQYIGTNVYTLQPGPAWVEIPALASLYEKASLSFSPDRQMIAYIGSGYHGPHWVVVTDENGENERELIKEGEYCRLDWSPDSQTLAVVDCDDNSILLVDVDTGEAEMVWKGKNVVEAIFTPDGQHLLISLGYSFDEEEDTLLLYNPKSGEERIIATLPFPAEDIALSSDGAMVAFNYDDLEKYSNSAYRGIWVVNLDGSGLRRVVNEWLVRKPVWAPDGSLLLFHRHNEPTQFGEHDVSLSLATLDGRVLPGTVELPEVTRSGVIWWIENRTPAVEARLQLIGKGAKERTINVDLADEQHGLQFTLHEIEVLRDRARVHLSITNLGAYGRAFLSGAWAALYTYDPDLSETGLLLKPAMRIPTTLPVGKTWDGWLETDEAVPLDAIGAVVAFEDFELAEPLDDKGNTQGEWSSRREGQEIWYQPLR